MKDKRPLDVTAAFQVMSDMEGASPRFDEPFRTLIEAVTDYAICVLDPAGYVTTWNTGAELIKRYTKEEALGQHFSRFFSDEDVESGKPDWVLSRAAEAGRVELESWRVRKGGSRFWAHSLVTALYDVNGELRGFGSMTRDLTNRRRSEVLLRSILDHTVDGIVSINPSGRIESFNAAAERIFGFREGEVLGRDVRLLFAPGDEADAKGHFHDLIEGGANAESKELTGVRKDGGTFPMELAVTEFVMEGMRHLTGIVRDLSERKRLENQLRQSQKMEAVGQLAGGVAHDFNNLLTIIAAHVDLVLDGTPARDPNRASLMEVMHAVERAAVLTRQLLAFSSQQVLEPAVLDLNEIVHNVERMLRRLIGEDIALTTALATDLKSVKADPGQMEQVLVNLAVNARDAMPRGGKLTIETVNRTLGPEDCGGPECPAGEYVQLSISDTGHGMDPEVKRRAFEPFFTTKAAGKGTGLGLATVYGIVRQSGGWITVYSEVDLGTTFKVYLPVALDVRSTETPREQPVRSGGGRETILLVEDEAGLRSAIENALKSYGYNVLSAGTGPDAIDVAMSYDGTIDLVVTDVVMPEMSGRELAERLREQKPGMAVLFMSGYTNDAVVRHGVLQAEMAFLQKPFGPPTLARKVREVLEGDSPADVGRRSIL